MNYTQAWPHPDQSGEGTKGLEQEVGRKDRGVLSDPGVFRAHGVSLQCYKREEG